VTEAIGPLLYLRNASEGRINLAALLVLPDGQEPPILEAEGNSVSATRLLTRRGKTAWRYDFSLPMRRDTGYSLGGTHYPVNADFTGDLRIAFVSCNGQEKNDRKRPLEERNAMWQRLQSEHDAAPFQLLLQGGDQIYADELLNSHPALKRWARGGRVRQADATAEPDLAETLRDGFFDLYLDILGQPAISGMMAHVPSLAMWDDHDICDGWGSLRPAKLDAPEGRTLFAAAREHFLLFQYGARPDELPGFCPDRSGTSLGWHVALPGLHVLAPDLRSERRPNRVMGPAGWQSFDTMLERIRSAEGGGRVLLLSSVPALGPRLSWVEALMHLTPRLEKYEDDLRDQWQSRAHRKEWRAFLERLAAIHANPATPVTCVSGEIHLATHGTLDVPPKPLHQLVASGIAHPAPSKAYAIGLGLLARFGSSPLPGHPIRLQGLPGQPGTYTAERNYLVLERRGAGWTASWELEHSGRTPELDI